MSPSEFLSGKKAGASAGRAADSDGGRSLFEQFTDIAKAVPSAVVKGVAGGVKEAAEITATIGGGGGSGTSKLPPGTTVDFNPDTGKVTIVRPAGSKAPKGGLSGSLRSVVRDFVRAKDGQSIKDAARENLPGNAAMVESVAGTAHRVTNPTEYAKAVKEGRIVGAVLEDLANLSIVARGGARVLSPAATKATKAATLADDAERYAEQVTNAARRGVASKDVAAATRQEAATLRSIADELAAGPAVKLQGTLSSVSRLGEQGAGLPAKPYVAAAKTAGKVGGVLVGKAADLAPLAGTVEALTARAERFADNQRVRRAVRDEYGVQQSALNERANVLRRIGEPLERRLSGDEQVAMRLFGEEDVTPGGGLAKVVDAASDDTALSAALDRLYEGRGDVPTPKAARLAVETAAALREGAELPDPAARIVGALDETAALRTRRTAEELAGVGRTDAGMNSEQVGAAPLSRVVDDAAAQYQRQLRQADRAVERAQRQVTRAYRAADTAPAIDYASATERLTQRSSKAMNATQAAAEAFDKGLASTVDRRAKADRAARSTQRFVQGVGTKAGRAAVASAEFDRAVAGLQRASTGLRKVKTKQADAVAKAVDGMAAAPARYRPAIVTNQRAVEVLADLADEAESLAAGSGVAIRAAASDIPVTLKALVDAGVDPQHFIGGGFDLPDLPTPIGPKGTPATGPRGTLTTRKTSAQRQRKVGAAGRSLRSQLGKEYERAVQVESNLAAQRVVGRFGRTADDLGLSGRGKELVDAADKLGYVPWNLANPFGKVAAEQVSTRTTFVPKAAATSFGYYFGKGPLLGHVPGAELALKVTFDVPHRVMRASVLALSPAWHVGNIVGNALMLTVGGGITPAQLARAIPEAWRMAKDGTAPRGLSGAGIASENLHYFLPGMKQPRTPLGKLIRGSYRLNGFVDDLSHNAAYIAKKGQGYSDEAAVRESLKIAGDFARMTPFERDVIRRAVPFYAWTRHVHKLAGHLALEHPARLVWTMHLADLLGDDQAELDDFLKGGIMLGAGETLRAGNLNPFAGVGSLLSVADTARSLSPSIKTLAGLAGVNLNRTKGEDAFNFTAPAGFEGKRPSIGRLAGQNFLRQFALLQDAADKVKGKAAVGRYDTGQPKVFADGSTAETPELSNRLLQLLGVPQKAKSDPEIAAIIAAKEEQRRRARQRYDERRSAAGL